MNSLAENQIAALVKQASQKIDMLQTELDQLKAAQHEPIAIIGMACRFPGADSPEAFWELLENGVDKMAEIPIQRWDVDTYYDSAPATPGKSYVRAGAFVDGVDQFDPQFFGISPREAILLDPQQRLLLEVTWEALERAGQSPTALKNSQTGVFIGVGQSEYTACMSAAQQGDIYSDTGNSAIFASGRLSYVLGLQGPNLVIDTACSASLIGVHMACESLRNGTSQLAIAGGVHLMLAPQGYIVMSQMQALAPDGRCKTFDAAANGYGRGEGSGIVILKRLSAAQRDGDPILALIRGSSTNHDGPSSGLTVPSATAQAQLIHSALATGKVEASEIHYVEAHGTGTSLGDPIEVRALAAVFGKRENPLLIGSVKTNFGHLEEAAGVAGLIKVVLSMQHNKIPRHLHCHNLNPYIDWERCSIRVTTEPTVWPAGKKLAGVSAFGMAGSNAHVIVEQAQAVEAAPLQAERPYHLLTLSAKNKAVLRELAMRYGALLSTEAAPTLGNVCYTAYTGRSQFAHRLSLIAATSRQMAERLVAYANGVVEAAVNQSEDPNPQAAPKVAFLFTGQGSQYLNMGRELYATQPIFRAVLDRCEEVAQVCLGRSLVELLYPAAQPTHNDLMESHPCGQATNFAIECALVDLWRSWGITPDLVLGHSLGDFAAAYTAGVLSLENGLRLVSERGRLMETARGSMLSVIACEAEMLPFLKNVSDVTIGVINGPKGVVLSGGQRSVALIAKQLQQAGFKTRMLTIPVAAHSPLLDPVLADFEALVRTVPLSAPQCAVVSSMTGALVTDELTDPTYWRRHLRNTVRFADGVQTLLQQGVTVFLEIGPKPTLVGMASQILDEAAEKNSAELASSSSPLMLSSLRDGHNDWQQMLESLGALYVRGVHTDWINFDKQYSRRKVVLPTYPFQRQRYWVDRPKQSARATLRPLLDQVTKLPLHNETIFETEFSVESLPFLADHLVYEAVVSPGACQLVMALSAAELIFGENQPLQLVDVILPQTLVIPTEMGRPAAQTVQAIFTPYSAGDLPPVTPKVDGQGAEVSRRPQQAFKVISFAAGSLQAAQGLTLATHAAGYAAPLVHEQLPVVDLAALQQRCIQPVDLAAYYATSAAAQIALGPSFRWLAEVWQGTDHALPEALAKVTIPATIGTVTGYTLHPGLLDACFQLVSIPVGDDERKATMLPFAAESIHLYRAVSGHEWWCYARQTSASKWDIQVLNTRGHLLLEVKGFEQRIATAVAIQDAHLHTDWLHTVQWVPTPASNGLTRAPAPACWLVFGDETVRTAAVITQLAGQGTPTIQVTPGAMFTIAPMSGVDRQWQVTVDPQSSATFQQLFATVAAEHSSIGVLYLWGMVDAQALSTVPEHTLSLCNSLLHLVQALAATTVTAKLWLVTQACHIINGAQSPGHHVQAHDEALIGERAAAGTLWGLGRTIAQEFPALGCTSIDLAAADPATNAMILQQEIMAGPSLSREPLAGQIAYRNGVRYTARLAAWTGAALPETQATFLSAEASYLITGGLGGLGLQVAEQLIADGAKYLVLSGRQGATTVVQATLAQWMASGVVVQVVQADVARLEDVQQLLRKCEALAPLRGIIHVAGLIDDGVLTQQSPTRFKKVMQPKVQGTWHLHTLTANHDLDFFVCFSSMSSLLGSPGQSNYAAANAFMDTLMQHRHALGLPGSSIQWGPWGEVGLAASLENQMQAQGMSMITPAQGRALFQYVLKKAPAQIGIIPAKISALGLLLATQQHTPQATERLAAPTLRQQLQTLASSERSALLERYLRAEIAQVLRLSSDDEIGRHDHLFNLGIDSLMAIELKNKVQADLGCTLRATLLFDYPTLADLILHLDKSTSATQEEPPVPPLVKANRNQPLPLSLAQQRLWFNQTTNRASSYNIVTPLRLEGKLDVPALEQSLTALLRRHEVLRTIFPTVDGTPRQVISAAVPVTLVPIDLQALPAAEQNVAIERLIQQEVQHLYELAQGPLIRVILAKQATEIHCLLFSFNHILIDAESMAQIFDEISILYAGFITGTVPPLPALSFQYADYATWQHQTLTPAIVESRVNYWRQRLVQDTPLFELCKDRSRPAKETFQGSIIPFQMTVAQTAQLKLLQSTNGATLFSSVLAVWTALLYRYGQGEELVVGSPFSNRTHKELAGVIGHWGSMLLLPMRFQGNPTFLELITQANQAAQAAMVNDVPLDQLVQALPAARKRNNLPHQFLLSFLPGKSTINLQLSGVTITSIEKKTNMLRPDLALMVWEEKNSVSSSLAGCWVYKIELHERESIMRMIEDFHSLLDAVLAEPTCRIKDVRLPNLSTLNSQKTKDS